MESLDNAKINERLNLFLELLHCNGKMYLWRYDGVGNLLETNAPHSVLDTLFRNSSILDESIAFSKKSKHPFISSIDIGMSWAVTFQFDEDDTLAYMHVIGPVFTSELSQESLDKYLNNPKIRASWRPTFERYIREIPLVTATNFFKYTLQLHYCITNEHLKPSDITFDRSSNKPETPGAPGESRAFNYAKIWSQENGILDFIKNGDIYSKHKIPSASNIIQSIHPMAGMSLEKSKQNATIFVGLCIRAAIEGGISPEKAYLRGQQYLDDIYNGKTFADVLSVAHSVYDDFVFMVHNHQAESTNYSPEIQSCVDYIESHPSEPLNISYLASKIGYTDYYLSRKFKAEIGMSINSYIKKARITQACYLLVSTDMDIQDICDNLNFGDRSFFSKVFKKETGTSPAKFRADHKRQL
ncbi:MAG: AraC family transcriptional regulator [Lachnospiraceae bacterium]|nr:AraC family transcriptional regulator [Lachnospiraceae bacterium]